MEWFTGGKGPSLYANSEGGSVSCACDLPPLTRPDGHTPINPDPRLADRGGTRVWILSPGRSALKDVFEIPRESHETGCDTQGMKPMHSGVVITLHVCRGEAVSTLARKLLVQAPG